MKIWELQFIEELYTLVDWEDYRKFFKGYFNGKSMLDIWSPIPVEDIKKGKRNLDCTMITRSCPVFNLRTLSLISPLLEGRVEILPLVHEKDKLFAINIINVKDYIDYPNAEVKIDERYNLVTEIKKYAFIKELVENETIFRIPTYRGTKTFVTDSFKNEIELHKITGLEFIEIWDSESLAPSNIDPQVIVHNGFECSFNEGLKHLDQGKSIVNDRWKLKIVEDGTILLGYLTSENVYDWQEAIFFPPTFLDMNWTVID